MFATMRRVVCPAIVLMSISLLCSISLPVFAQSYTPSPSELDASVQQTYPGTGTNTSAQTGGLPSVTVSGGMATVTFDFQATMYIYQGQGTATVQYISDQESSWADLPGSFSSSSNQTFGPEPEWASVYVNNLSTLHFRVLVTAWVEPNSGNVTTSATASNLSVSVSSGGPPPNATVFSNLQTIQDWKVCEGECVINGTNTGPPNDNGYLYYGISSPSLSGASMEQEDQSVDPYFDVLYSLDDGTELDHGLTLGCSSAPCPFNHFIDDLWFYIPQSSLGSIENLEFDPDYSDPNGNTYKMSVMCTSSNNSAHPNQWAYWDSYANTWVFPQKSGQYLSCLNVWNNYGQWQHLTIQVVINSDNTYTYQALSIGTQGSPQQSVTWDNMGATLSPGPTPSGWPMNVWVQQEIDNSYSGGTSIVYYDDYTLTAWYQ